MGSIGIKWAYFAHHRFFGPLWLKSLAAFRFTGLLCPSWRADCSFLRNRTSFAKASLSALRRSLRRAFALRPFPLLPSARAKASGSAALTLDFGLVGGLMISCLFAITPSTPQLSRPSPPYDRRTETNDRIGPSFSSPNPSPTNCNAIPVAANLLTHCVDFIE